MEEPTSPSKRFAARGNTGNGEELPVDPSSCDPSVKTPHSTRAKSFVWKEKTNPGEETLFMHHDKTRPRGFRRSRSPLNTNDMPSY
jgi:hypothetical protein